MTRLTNASRDVSLSASCERALRRDDRDVSHESRHCAFAPEFSFSLGFDVLSGLQLNPCPRGGDELDQEITRHGHGRGVLHS